MPSLARKETRYYITVFVFIVSLSLIFLSTCGGIQSTKLFDPTATPTDPQILIQEIEAAYQAGNFESAYELSKKAVQASPNDAALWEMVRKSVIAQAGDEYLQRLPDRRYRLSPEAFLADQVNGRQYFILDVRQPEEFEKGHVEGAVNIPLKELLLNIDQLPDSGAPILVYCRSQKRSTHALVILRELGYVQVFNLEGGYTAYQEFISSNPMPTPGPTPTLEPVKDGDGC